MQIIQKNYQLNTRKYGQQIAEQETNRYAFKQVLKGVKMHLPPSCVNIKWKITATMVAILITVSFVMPMSGNSQQPESNMDRNEKMAETFFQNPDIKKMMRKEIVSRNADFIEAFQISSDDADAFADILLAEQLAGLELINRAAKIHDPTDADRTKFQQLWDDNKTEYEAKKIDLLGETIYQDYPAYVTRYSIENWVEDFSGLFDSEEQLTDTQREKLVNALLEAQKIYTAESAGEGDDTFIFQSDYYDEAIITRMFENTTRRNNAFLESAQGILSVSQSEKIETYLTQRLEKMVSVWNMGALDYGYETIDLEGDTEPK